MNGVIWASQLGILVILMTGCASNKAKPASIPKNADPIQYLSDSDSGYEYLERLQKDAYTRTNSSPQWTDSDDKRKSFGQMGRKLDEKGSSLNPQRPYDSPEVRKIIKDALDSKLPTRYENPITYWLMLRMASRISDAAIDLSLKKGDIPRFGTLPIATVNAEAIPVPDGSLVVVNQNTFLFAYELTKLALLTIDIDKGPENKVAVDSSEERLKSTLRENPEIRTRLALLILFFLGLEPPPAQFLVPGQYHRPLITAVDGIELFVVGHEYAHVILGHIPTGTASLRLTSDPAHSANSVQKALHSWAQELEADVLGCILMSRAVDQETFEAKKRGGIDGESARTFSAYKKASPLIFLQSAEILEEASYVLKHKRLPPPEGNETAKLLELFNRVIESGVKGNSVASTISPEEHNLPEVLGSHPPAKLRQAILRRTLERHVLKDLATDEASLFRISLALDRNLAAIWESVRPLLPELFVKLEKSKK